LAVIALVLAVVGAQQTARAQSEQQPALNVELSMADGASYDHSTGGGSWGDGPGGEPGDVWDEQQWPPTYACDDVVSLMLLVTSDSVTGVDPSPRTVEVDLLLSAGSHGQPGAGYTEFVGVTVLHDDPGAVSDADSSASLVGEDLQGLHTTEGKLRGTVVLTGVELGERIIVRVDVRVTCAEDIRHAGILYGQLDQPGPGQSGFREVTEDGARDLGAGQNLIQLIQLDGEAGPPATTPPTTTPTTTPGGTTTTTTTSPPVGGESDPGLVIDKRAGGVVDVDGSGTVNAGDRLDYELVVTNVGDEVLTGVVVSDPKPGTSAPVCPGLVGGTLAVGATVTCTVSYTLTAADIASGTVSNTGSADSDQTPPVTDTVVVPLAVTPGTVTVIKVADRDSAVVGETITYTISVTNGTGGALTGVVVSDPLVGLSAPIANLPAGATESFSVEYVPTTSDLELGQVTNVATVTSDQRPPVTAQETVAVTAVIPFTAVSVLPSGPVSLPRTGSDTARTLWWSAALVVAGLSLLTAARGRRQLDELA
jgi:uncharacterized repeat protein (TIGR01451 family)